MGGGGGGLQAGGLPGLSRAVGVCGEGKPPWNREFIERRSGDSGAWSVTRETARTNAESDRGDNRES